MIMTAPMLTMTASTCVQTEMSIRKLITLRIFSSANDLSALW